MVAVRSRFEQVATRSLLFADFSDDFPSVGQGDVDFFTDSDRSCCTCFSDDVLSGDFDFFPGLRVAPVS